jgi:hypothetical protein
VVFEGARVKRGDRASAHGSYRLWHQRYQDLCLIAEHHAFMRSFGVAEGLQILGFYCVIDVLRH